MLDALFDLFPKLVCLLSFGCRGRGSAEHITFLNNVQDRYRLTPLEVPSSVDGVDMLSMVLLPVVDEGNLTSRRGGDYALEPDSNAFRERKLGACR